MLKQTRLFACHQHGNTMLEVLITILILAFGLLGLAGLQAKIQSAELESFQRAQAMVLLNDMVNRINTNRANAANYVSANTMGTGDAQPASCSALAVGVSRDQCEWSNALKGAAETSAGSKIGAMIGARGCAQLVQAEDATATVCTPGIYLVTVAWQGVNMTSIPGVSCGRNAYGDDRYRRAISARVSIGLPSCS